MKYRFHLLALLLVPAFISACHKAALPVIPTVSLNVVNASPGLSPAFAHIPSAGYYSQLSGVYYGGSSVFTLAPNAAVTVTGSDTTKALYSGAPASAAGDIYSLFLGGAAGEDVVLNKDHIPGRPDSTMGVRIVNMSTGSGPVAVALLSSVGTNEFDNVAYKGITDFKSYSAKSTDPANIRFEIKSSAGDSLTVSAPLSAHSYRFKNITLVLGGSYPSGLSVFTVNNF